MHRAGPTYGGKNTPALQQSDAKDLQGAANRDSEAMISNAQELSSHNVSALQSACGKISCTTNDQYDEFLLNQLDE